MSRKKPPHYSNAKIASGTHNAAVKRKGDKKRADKAKTKQYNSKELDICTMSTTNVSKKLKSILPFQIANGALNAASKKKDAGAAEKAKKKQNSSKELETGTIATTGVAKKGAIVSPKTANGALNVASKKKDAGAAEKAKKKQNNSKELETGTIATTDVAKKGENVSPKTANGDFNAASKKKDEGTAEKIKKKQNNSKELETGTIATTGVAKKGENVSPKTANGALNVASKKKDEITAEKTKNKQSNWKELETGTIPTTGVAKKRETVASKTANGALNAALKKKDESTPDKASQKKKCDTVVLEQCIIPTTGVARKRKSVPPPSTANDGVKEQRNGAKLESASAPAKKRPRADIDSESNSEAENYIDKFFIDATDDAADVANGGDGGTSEEDEEDYDTDTDDGNSEEYEDGSDDDDDAEEAMPFDALLNYYGQRRDTAEQRKLMLTEGRKSPAAPKNAPVPKANTSGWIVEDNDQDLRYETEYEGNGASDEEPDPPRKKKTKTPAVAKRKSLVHGSVANVSPGDKVAKFEHDSSEDLSLEEEEWDEEDDFSDEFSGSVDTEEELDSNSDMWTDGSEEEYLEQSYDESYSDDSADSGAAYLQQPYDSDSYDEDYAPSDSECEQEDEQYIPRGMAQIYDIDDNSVPFDEGVSQIVEVPNDSGTEGKTSTTDAPSDTDAQSDTSIPVLVPIYTKQGEFIDSPEKLKTQPGPTAKPAKATTVGGAEVEQVVVVAPQEAMETDVTETSEKGSEGLKENEIEQAAATNMADEEMTGEEVYEEEEKEEEEEQIKQSSLYRLYDAIEGRMALVVLKQEINFYGHVSVQALSGRVEMLGYRLETGETRTVYAARGFNAVRLIPLPSTEPFDRASFEATLEKLAPNFIDAEIRELIESFDPSESVLVLLRSDRTEDGLVPIICNFLEEYNLFPTVNTLAGKSPFRRTEFLLDVEFYTTAVAPARSIPVFQNDPAWDDVRLQASGRLLVVGGKGAGKSTLCQFLVNRFIRQFGRIVLIDLDIGQSLLHLPETINASVLHDPILGVGCFARVQPLRSLLFGSLNVVSSPLLYVQNVRTLVQYCEANPELNGIPWIVNTMGYVSGFGEELMAAIIRLVRPTDVIQLTIPKHMKGVQNYANAQTDSHVNGYRFNILREEMGQLGEPLTYRFHPMVVRYDQRGLPLHPPKRRTLSIMAQLVQILGDANEWFTDIKPFSAPLDELQILITRDEYTPSKEMMPKILNAMLVYLCERLDNGQYNCLGVGIVRAVDQNNNVHLLHYLPPDQLARAKVLALCNTSLPSQIYLRLNSKMDGTIPYLQNIG